MKRIAVLVIVTTLVVFAVSADESVVIDFNKVVADFPADNPTDNKATIIDFSNVAGASFSEAQKALMKTSLAVNKWEVRLNSSANSVVNASDSFTKVAMVKEGATKYANESILGVRIRFPTEPWHSYADIRPPFEIPAYADKMEVAADGTMAVTEASAGKGDQFDGMGIVKNVGVIKSISVNVFGNNYPHLLSVFLKDQTGMISEYKLGYLNFDGWRTLTYENPSYIRDVRNRDLRSYPLYPSSFPFQKLIGFRVYKDGASVGGDFVSYIKDLSIVYDKALLSADRDIDDEATWKILQQREAVRRNVELKRLGNLQVLRVLEDQKMDKGAAQQPAATDGAAAQQPATAPAAPGTATPPANPTN